MRYDAFAYMVPRNRQRMRRLVIEKQCELLRALRLECFQTFLNQCDAERCARALFGNDRAATDKALQALTRAYWNYVGWLEELRLRVIVLDSDAYPFVINRTSATGRFSANQTKKGSR
jgi:hypothetical protein